MKRNLIATLALGLLLAASAHAQNAMKVNIPFDFVVNGHHMSAGEYRVETLGTARIAISIRGADKALALTLACTASEPALKSKLIFHPYGEEYFLEQLRTPAAAQRRRARDSERTADAPTRSLRRHAVNFTAGYETGRSDSSSLLIVVPPTRTPARSIQRDRQDGVQWPSDIFVLILLSLDH